MSTDNEPRRWSPEAQAALDAARARLRGEAPIKQTPRIGRILSDFTDDEIEREHIRRRLAKLGEP